MMASLTLGECVSLQRGKTYKSKLLDLPGPVLLGLASIGRDGGFRRDKLRTYGGDSPTNLIVTPDELYVSLKDVTQSGDLLGSVARLPQDVFRGRLTQDTVKLIPEAGCPDLNLIYWVLRSPQYRAYCRAHATGTTNLGLPRDDFLAFPIPQESPDLLALASLLSALDDKIDLNRRMNETLEAMARAIFKSWFVDFDPVRAKAEGKQPFGIDADTAALFPDRLVDSELGPIPEGWEVRPLDQIADFVNGAACQKFSAQAGQTSLPVIKIREMTRGITKETDRASLDVPEKHRANDGDVLFSWSATLLCKIWTGGTGFVNQHIFKVTSEEFPRWFYLYWTKHHLDEFKGIAADKATTMGHIKRSDLYLAKAVVPPIPIIDLGNKCLAYLDSLQVSNNLESRTLAELRDLLLPKLLSGEIRVKDAEKIVEDAV